VRRLRALVDRHPDFWRLASRSVLADIAADLVGPDVKFHSSKLNYKWPGSGEIVDWHQDIPAWPHTNYSPVTLGIYLGDVPGEQGPLTCIPGSHKGPIFVHRDEAGAWTGAIRKSDHAAIDMAGAVDLTGPAGTVIAINCRTVHGSRANLTDRVRPVALFVYSSADAFTWMPIPTPDPLYRRDRARRGGRGRASRPDAVPGSARLEPPGLRLDLHRAAGGAVVPSPMASRVAATAARSNRPRRRSWPAPSTTIIWVGAGISAAAARSSSIDPNGSAVPCTNSAGTARRGKCSVRKRSGLPGGCSG
jgi:hypothetical protein